MKFRISPIGELMSNFQIKVQVLVASKTSGVKNISAKSQSDKTAVINAAYTVVDREEKTQWNSMFLME